MRVDVPVDPDPDEARRWLEVELGRGEEYTPDEPPDWLRDFLEWLRELLSGGDASPTGPSVDGGPTVGIVVVIVLVAALLIVAFAIFGLPRLRRRSKVTGDLFGEDDDRSSRRIRTAAQQAAAAGDYTAAVVEVFRSMARDLAERGIVTTFPGTTAQEFARRAGDVFPASLERLADAAGVFDGVRYLDRVGTEEQWRRMSALETELRAARAPKAPRASAAFDAPEQPTEARR